MEEDDTNSEGITNHLERLQNIHYRFPQSFAHSSAIFPPKTFDYTEGTDLFQVSTYPVPIFTRPCSLNFNKNPAITLMTRKLEWQAERKKLKKEANCYYSRKKTGQKLVNHSNISQKTINYAVHLQNDPDPFMTSTAYDWYYNGSNLETIELNGKAYLIQPAFGEYFELDLIKLTTPEIIVGSTRSNKLLEYTAKYGYEIIKSRFHPTNFHFCVRQLNSLRFFRRIHKSRVKNTKHKFIWEKNLLAGSFIGIDGFCFLDSDNMLVNLETSTKTCLWSRSMGKDISNAFPTTLGAWDEYTLAHTNPSSLNFLDFRKDPTEPVEIINSSSFLFNCERISCQLKSLKENLIYLGTYHNMYGVDPRMGNKPVIQITHQLQKTPTIAKSIQFQDNEVICLSSNTVGDLKVFSNSLNESHVISRLGLKPKSILETFNECKMRGKFLFAKTMEEHVQYNVSGALPIVLDNKLNLLTQNCVGDIFRSVLLPNIIKDDEDDKKVICHLTLTPSILKTFEEWNTELENNEVKGKPDLLKVNNIVRMRGVKRILGSSGLQAVNQDEDVCNEVKPIDEDLLNNVPPWKLDVPKYYNYKDVLAADLLSVWEFEPSENNDLTLSSATIQSQIFLDQVPKAFIKVNNWFSQMNSTTVPHDYKPEIDMKETLNPIIPENPIEVPTTSQPKVQKIYRKPKFEKGF